MSQVVGVYEREGAAMAALRLFMGAGFLTGQLSLFHPGRDASRHAALRHRGELMFRKAVRWGIIGALVTELPMLVALFLISVDVNVKVLLASTVWKFGGTFGAWLGAMAASDRGLESDVAARYEALLEDGKWVLAATVRPWQRPFARGAMLESDALEVSDIRGTFETKPKPVAVPA